MTVLKVTPVLYPGHVSPVFKEARSPLRHDCLVTTEQVCSGRWDLESDPIQDPEQDLRTGGSRMIRNRKQAAGCAAGILTQAIEDQTLSFNTSA